MIPADERPVLAGRAGRYIEALPAPALRAHFQCIWMHSVPGRRATRIAVVPDGCVDLLWRDGRFVVAGPDKTLYDRLNMSERTLRRWSNQHFGYGLKTLDRILRFQRFRGLALANADDRLAGLAFEAGYSDQAHLGRDIQALCGMSAGKIRAPAHRLTGRFVPERRISLA